LVWLALIILQHLLYLLSRIMDDISWQTVPLDPTLVEAVSAAAIALCMLLKLGRKYCYEMEDFRETVRLYFVNAQVKFLIPWSLTFLNAYLFYNIFGCYAVLPASDFLYLQLSTCIANIVQLFLTNLNYSFATNTKTQLSELVFYEAVLFGEIIYNGSLLVSFVSTLEGKSKDLSILYLSLMIANQMLIMDLMFRGAYEERLQEEELKLTIREYISLNNRQNAYANS
jgi:hypothetical protein